MNLTKLITPAQVARLLDSPGDHWDTRRARLFLKKCGALTKVNGRWVTNLATLMQKCAPVADIVADME